MLICIDAGHYLKTPGKRCLKSIDPNETREWVLNSRVADRLQDILAGYSCQTIRADDPTGKKEVTLAQRVKLANDAKADLYLSIHHNAGIKGGSGGGIAVYVQPGADSQSRAVQKAVYEATAASTGLRGNRANPIAESDLYVLRNSRMPSILGEFGFMDSTTDTPIILTEEHAVQTAQGIAAALVRLYDLEELDDMTYEKWKEYMERYRAELAQLPPSMPELLADAKGRGLTDGTRPRDLVTREECAVMARAAANR